MPSVGQCEAIHLHRLHSSSPAIVVYLRWGPFPALNTCPLSLLPPETLKDLTEQMNTSLNKGDLLSAKELLARMKYFTNLEEKVKEKLTENL
ncbi:hypothetical protein NFI96_029981 [Prochilodus magdalenae]|nr:hypothetical protein NFI96_029981 [Prochilodus magdalenae]